MEVFKNLIIHCLLIFNKILIIKGIPILQYHRISNTISPEDVHSVYTHEFENQISFLVKNGYKTILLDDVIKRLKNGYNKNEKLVSITFDDGHKDNLKFAYPILKKYNLVATIFVIPAYVGKSGWLDSDGNLVNARTHQNMQKWDLLSWDELREMGDVFKIESHGLSHKKISTITTDAAIVELKEPIREIYQQINIKPNHYCYPFGKFNYKIFKLVEFAGYKAAYSTIKGINTCNNFNQWKLKRNEIGTGISENQFKLVLSGGIRTYHLISILVNRLTSFFYSKKNKS